MNKHYKCIGRWQQIEDIWYIRIDIDEFNSIHRGDKCLIRGRNDRADTIETLDKCIEIDSDRESTYALFSVV